jgi:hypothetical protein
LKPASKSFARAACEVFWLPDAKKAALYGRLFNAGMAALARRISVRLNKPKPSRN